MNQPKNVFGLIGNPIKHSFSKNYFEDKFRKQNLNSYEYALFELQTLSDTDILLKQYGETLKGFNVTSPYKIQIMDYLDYVSEDAHSIGAVNTVKVVNGKLNGYNTDWKGFLCSLDTQTKVQSIRCALILGTGGAAKSVSYALNKRNIKSIYVTTKTNISSTDTIRYSDLNKFDNFDMFDLIVNATPCGMVSYPPIADIDIHKITSKHIVMDLIYNPERTLLLDLSAKQGAATVNGLQMLYTQAEESWKIWQYTD